MNSNAINDISIWYPWPHPALEMAPNLPGIYVFRLMNASCGRVLGHSDVVYIGTTSRGSGSLSGRLKQHSQQLDGRYWLRRVCSEVGALEVAWIVLPKHADAVWKEGELLRRYADDHIDLPPGNRQRSGKKSQDLLQDISNLPHEEQQKVLSEIAKMRGSRD